MNDGGHIALRALKRLSAELLPTSWLVRHGPSDRPAVALTFDDGPDAHTLALLDALDAHGLVATFFVVGRQVERFPEAARAIVERGHEIASHSWGHDRIGTLSVAAHARDLARVQAILPRASRRRPLYRPPWGDVTPRTLATTAALGYTTALWSLDSLDHRPIGREGIARQLASHRPRPGDVVLLHEGEAETRAALADVAALLAADGLGTAQMSDLLGV